MSFKRKSTDTGAMINICEVYPDAVKAYTDYLIGSVLDRGEEEIRSLLKIYSFSYRCILYHELFSGH
ncbi:Hypothetical predicted protein [Octopus vulgaris]|uniref:Uncharacterized protein n=1 Tax=Octopus vulgaris TaxID=6645 RepID=A0AA36F9V7_OCTVU|nr:Hypothetical predicted protein [Octopus vulgaris]